jgi:hypothetical protein
MTDENVRDIDLAARAIDRDFGRWQDTAWRRETLALR